MTDKAKAIQILKLLSALESWGFSNKQSLPDYLLEDLDKLMVWLEAEILK